MNALRLAGWLVVFLIGAAGAASAQVPIPEPQPCHKAVKSAAELRVVAACKDPLAPHPYETTRQLQADSRVLVIVEGLSAYMRLASQKPEEAARNLRLFLNDSELSSLLPLLPSEGYSHLTFDLAELRTDRDRHKATLGQWRRLLTLGLRDEEIKLSVGFAGQKPFTSSVAVELRAVPTPWFIAWLVLAVVLSAVLVVAARRSNILRVPGEEPEIDPATQKRKRKAFSLARMQMAAWFLVVLLAYTLIWLTTGALDTITDTVLGLMGISAATAFAATVIDTNGQPATAPGDPTRGLWNDLISEGRDASLPRLQILIWTVVLILIFARAIYDTLEMPEFNATLLGLMGISGGTYVGFKKPDQPVKK